MPCPRVAVFVCVVTCLTALLAVPGAAQLVNGGAETGSLAPWTPDLSGASSGNSAIIKAVTTQVQTAPPVFPAVGARFFSFATQVAGPAGASVSMQQTVALSAPPQVLALTGRIQTEFGDFGEVLLEILDAGGGVLTSADSGHLVSDLLWSGVFVQVDVPASAASCRVTLTGTVVTGMAVNVFWDELALGASPWSLVGPGLAGEHGVPVIAGSGPLVGDEPFSIALDGAATNTTAWFVLGFTDLSAPFKFGVMVPYPDLVVPLPTGPNGALLLAGAWPVGVPSGVSIWAQWWVVDAVGPLGFASTRGVRGTTP